MDAQLVRAEAEQKWEDVDVTAIDDRIVELEGDLEDLKSDLSDAQDEFDKYKDLNKDNTKRKTAPAFESRARTSPSLTVSPVLTSTSSTTPRA